MTWSLRGLLLSLTSVALVGMVVAEAALELRQRAQEAELQIQAQTRLLTSAGAPLLLNALVVGDLATVEQTLRSVNTNGVWRQVRLYEPDGRRLIMDASPLVVPRSDAPAWFGRLVARSPGETRIRIAAEPVTYAVLAVTPSSSQLVDPLWTSIRASIVITVVLLAVFLAVMNIVIARGLRPVRDLGASAARLGAGDLSARMPETRFVEIASTARAFNTMAENLATAMAELRAKEAALEQREAERRRAERGRAAQLAVSRVIAESDAPEGAIRRLLEAIGASLRWDWGEVWRADDEAGLLRRLERWSAAPEAAEGDGDAPGGAIPRGAGLAGRVWATGEADWIEDVQDVQGGRGDAAHVAAGMRTACAFPVRAGRGVVAVMAFGSAEIRPPDDALLATMTGLGGQIGQFLERKEGEDVLRRTEEQLRGMQKMDAIGQLAGGVAHDFNNLLTVIIGRSAMLLGQLRSVDPVRRDIQLIHDTAERAANLTRQLLAFGRKQVMQPRPLNLNAVAEGLTPMLRRLIGENIQLVTQFDPGLGLVQADPSRIEQVIVNLAVNARDAMPRGGRLTVETANVAVDAEYVRRHPGARAGAHARLAVSDTGIGMDRTTAARIFEPFFTTKGPGEGTGLGLSTVYGIVKQSGGTIWVYSEPGQGTAFKVYLPIAAQAAVAAEAEARAVVPSRGSETVLIAEDEEGVRELARDLLEAFGYRVLEAADPDEAIAVSRGHAGSVDLLLTDVIMPGISGRELADRLRAERPALKILYMSGYTDRAIVHHGVLDPDVAFLEKPFAAADLRRKVREVLDVGAGVGASPAAPGRGAGLEAV